MRTTLNLEDDVFDLVREYAESRSIAIGKAVSELVRRGLQAPTPSRLVNGFVVYDVPPDSPPITSECVKQLEDEID